jgi:hypothetical protein
MTSIHIGIPNFYVSLSNDTSSGEFTVGAVSQPSGVKAYIRRQPFLGGIDGALSVLVSQFASLAGPFVGNDASDGLMDLGSFVGLEGLRLRRQGLYVTLEATDGEEIRFMSESVIVIEVMMAVGDQLAEWSSNAALVEAWKVLRVRSELLPMSRETDLHGPSTAIILDEATWYAARLGQQVGYYVNVARWLRARQFLFALGRNSTEPTLQEYRIDAVLELPPVEVLNSMVSEAATAFGESEDEFIADAVCDRNMMARQEVVYRRWYGSSPSVA